MKAVPEVRAGYYVSTQDRPAFETDLTPEELDSVFDQMYKDHERWQQKSNGHLPEQSSAPEKDPM